MIRRLTLRLEHPFRIRFLLASMMGLVAPQVFAAPSLVRYIDEEAGFALLDQVPSDIKDGDRVCLFETSQASPTCDVMFRWMTRNPLVFPKKEALARWDVGTVLEIKKIYFNGKDAGEAGPPDVTTFNNSLLKNRETDEALAKVPALAIQNKFPKGAPPAVNVESPTIEGDDFPEIYVPKLRKAKRKSKREVSELDATVKSIKKALKDRGLVSYSFLTDEAKEDVVPKAVREDYPNPLHGAVEISLLQVLPVVPMATYQSLSFRTITNATVNRSTLWNLSLGRLTPSAGGGIEVQISTKQTSFVNVGWRYHVYNSLKTRSTFDEFDTSLVAETTSRIGEQIVSSDWGRRQMWTDNFFTSYSLGLDLAYTDLNFRSSVAGNGTTAPFVVAFARRNFLTAAPRSQLRVGYQRFGWGISLSSLIIIPAFNFRDTFNGEVAVPDRVRFQGSAQEDLKRSLRQQKSPVAAEIYLTLSYQPQRD